MTPEEISGVLFLLCGNIFLFLSGGGGLVVELVVVKGHKEWSGMCAFFAICLWVLSLIIFFMNAKDYGEALFCVFGPQ